MPTARLNRRCWSWSLPATPAQWLRPTRTGSCNCRKSIAASGGGSHRDQLQHERIEQTFGHERAGRVQKFQLPVPLRRVATERPRLRCATVTPHVFVLGNLVDGSRKVVYMGAIDDNMDAERVKHHYLADALDASLQADAREGDDQAVRLRHPVPLSRRIEKPGNRGCKRAPNRDAFSGRSTLATLPRRAGVVLDRAVRGAGLSGADAITRCAARHERCRAGHHRTIGRRGLACRWADHRGGRRENRTACRR